MIQILVLLFAVLFATFCGTYGFYFAYVKIYAGKPWKLEIDEDFKPKISVLIPVYNEENSIESKLQNLKEVSYPKEDMEILVADDASEDRTLAKVEEFTGNNPELNIRVVKQKSHSGKSVALNKALSVSSYPLVVVSDADTEWPADVLQNALPYLSNPKVGAVTARGVNRNRDESWVTEGEKTYLNLSSLLRLGESKIYSTIRFEGGFCAYKKDAFEKFDYQSGADDSGTALEAVQKGYRTIMVPEVIFYTKFPTSLIGKLKIKVRRANQLISLWVKCLKLLWRRHLLLPKKIVLPQLMLFMLNPIILIALIGTGLTTTILFPFSTFTLSILLFIAVSLLFAREIFFELFIDNMILFYAAIAFILGKRYVAWEKT